MNKDKIIKRAIEFCRELIRNYNNDRDIKDTDINYLIKILEGMEWGL